MELDDFTGKPCRTKLAYEFLPKKKASIDLGIAALEATSAGTVEVNTKVLLMIKIDNCTLSLFPSGKILVRGERDEEKAKKIAEKLVKALKASVK